MIYHNLESSKVVFVILKVFATLHSDAVVTTSANGTIV